MKRSPLLCLVAMAAAAVGCHHAAKVPAPQVAPKQQAVVQQPKPAETRVESTKNDFVAPNADADDVGTDPTNATMLAEKKGWLKDAFFAFDSSSLSSDAQANLQTSAKWIESHPKFGVLVEGHCDERGTERYNLSLGERRAYEAKEYLETLGVSGNEMKTISYGKEKPFDDGHDEAAWAKNRRAHVVLTSAK